MPSLTVVNIVTVPRPCFRPSPSINAADLAQCAVVRRHQTNERLCAPSAIRVRLQGLRAEGASHFLLRAAQRCSENRRPVESLRWCRSPSCRWRSRATVAGWSGFDRGSGLASPRPFSEALGLEGPVLGGRHGDMRTRRSQPHVRVDRVGDGTVEELESPSADSGIRTSCCEPLGDVACEPAVEGTSSEHALLIEEDPEECLLRDELHAEEVDGAGLGLHRRSTCDRSSRESGWYGKRLAQACPANTADASRASPSNGDRVADRDEENSSPTVASRKQKRKRGVERVLTSRRRFLRVVTCHGTRGTGGRQERGPITNATASSCPVSRRPSCPRTSINCPWGGRRRRRTRGPRLSPRPSQAPGACRGGRA